MLQKELNSTGLNISEIEKIRSIFQKYSEVEKVILYGSRSKGNFKSFSDIDLTLVGKKINLTIQQKIESDLDDLLLPYKCDLSIYHLIQNKDLIEHIKRVGQQFF
jgi:type I restriction enzyme S subunit